MLSWYNMILHHKILRSVVMTNLVFLSLLWIDQRFNPRSPCWDSFYSIRLVLFYFCPFTLKCPGSFASCSMTISHNPQLSRKLKLQSALLLYTFEVFCLFFFFVVVVCLFVLYLLELERLFRILMHFYKSHLTIPSLMVHWSLHF